jgi:hypothetical protein
MYLGRKAKLARGEARVKSRRRRSKPDDNARGRGVETRESARGNEGIQTDVKGARGEGIETHIKGARGEGIQTHIKVPEARVYKPT